MSLTNITQENKLRTIKIEVMQHTTMELEAVHVINVNEDYPVTIEFENKILSVQLVKTETK